MQRDIWFWASFVQSSEGLSGFRVFIAIGYQQTTFCCSLNNTPFLDLFEIFFFDWISKQDVSNIDFSSEEYRALRRCELSTIRLLCNKGFLILLWSLISDVLISPIQLYESFSVYIFIKFLWKCSSVHSHHKFFELEICAPVLCTLSILRTLFTLVVRGKCDCLRPIHFCSWSMDLALIVRDIVLLIMLTFIIF